MWQTIQTVLDAVLLVASVILLFMTPRLARKLAGEYPKGSYGFWAWRNITYSFGLIVWTGLSLAHLPGVYIGQTVVFAAFFGPLIMGYHSKVKVPRNTARANDRSDPELPKQL